jgi:hypothetical protein
LTIDSRGRGLAYAVKNFNEGTGASGRFIKYFWFSSIGVIDHQIL